MDETRKRILRVDENIQGILILWKVFIPDLDY